MFTMHFVSRNKDNKDVANFRQRSKVFLWDGEKDFSNDWKNFVNDGVLGETVRCYRSLNPRDKEKVNKGIIHFLVDNPDYDPWRLPAKMVAIADKEENAAGKLWLWDCDENKVICDVFCQHFPKDTIQSVRPTKNGFAIISKRFDARPIHDLLARKKWDITFKKDSPLLIAWTTKS